LSHLAHNRKTPTDQTTTSWHQEKHTEIQRVAGSSVAKTDMVEKQTINKVEGLSGKLTYSSVMTIRINAALGFGPLALK
jgi:hypothetical protein